jgi:hypothetical protein
VRGKRGLVVYQGSWFDTRALKKYALVGQKLLFWGSGICESEARPVKHLREQKKQGFWAGY